MPRPTAHRLAGAAAAVAALVAVMAPGCGGDGDAPGPGDLDVDLVVGAEVAVVDFGFEPDEVTVTGGEVVEFTNEGDEAHTITADDGAFDAGEQRPGETFSFITDPVEESRQLDFHCEIHPGRMRGTLTVEPRQGPPGDGGG